MNLHDIAPVRPHLTPRQKRAIAAILAQTPTNRVRVRRTKAGNTAIDNLGHWSARFYRMSEWEITNLANHWTGTFHENHSRLEWA